MSEKHTPGPWKEYCGFVSSDGDRYGNSCDVTICEIQSHYDSGLSYYHDFPIDKCEAIQEANVRLIVASPDLLSALKAIVEHPDTRLPDSIGHAAIDAIEKAEGRSEPSDHA